MSLFFFSLFDEAITGIWLAGPPPLSLWEHLRTNHRFNSWHTERCQPKIVFALKMILLPAGAISLWILLYRMERPHFTLRAQTRPYHWAATADLVRRRSKYMCNGSRTNSTRGSDELAKRDRVYYIMYYENRSQLCPAVGAAIVAMLAG